MTNPYDKANGEKGPFHLVSQTSFIDEIGDTYHRVTQWPFQCWPMTYVSIVHMKNSPGKTTIIKGRTYSYNNKREHSHSPRACPRTLSVVSVSRGLDGANGATT